MSGALPTAVFSSWHGRFSDSPRAISAELLRRGAPVRQVWVVGDAAGPLPDGVSAVAAGSEEEEREFAAARWIVSNDVLPLDFVKRPGAVYVQTWHGTPLKRIGYDVENPLFPEAEYHYTIELGRDVARWDILLSPNGFASRVLPRAFRFGGAVLESGYPRNAVLVAEDRDAVRDRVRAELGIGPDTCAVLYAPTWRDSFESTFRLDLDLVASELSGGRHVLLVRAHGLTAATHAQEDRPGVLDVTRWPEIAELYLAADVLVTDYSSAMFDFAVTRKPQLFFADDLEDYRDRIRGFYLDYERVVPGPVLRTSAEVAGALRDVRAATAPYAVRYEAFAARFCALDDGLAPARVVDQVFGPPGGDPRPPALAQEVR